MLFESRLNLNLIHLHGNHLINHIYTEKLTNQREANKHKPAVMVEQRMMEDIYRLRLMNQISFLRRGTPGFSYTATM